jgi:hypothetical protein
METSTKEVVQEYLEGLALDENVLNSLLNNGSKKGLKRIGKSSME